MNKETKNIDYTCWGESELIEKIIELEKKLKEKEDLLRIAELMIKNNTTE